MKICFVGTYNVFVRQRMLNTYEKILPPNTEIFLFAREDSLEGFKLARIKKIGYKSNKLFVWKELRKFVINNQIDIVTNLSGGALMALTMSLATVGTKAKNIYYDRGNPKKGKLLLLSLFQLMLDKYLTCSPDFIPKVKRHLFLIKNKVKNLPIPIDSSLFIPINKQKARRELNLNPNDKIIIYAGRIEYLKGADYLLKAAKRNPDKKFILIGEMLDPEFKKQLLNLRNVQNLIVKDPKKLNYYYSAADLCLFLSRTEGHPFVPREAMLSGTPAIVSDIESLRLIEPAIKVPFNIEVIHKEINSFFALPNLEKDKLNKRVREYAEREWSEENLTKLHEELLLNI